MFWSFFDCGTKIFLFSLVSTPAPQVRGLPASGMQVAHVWDLFHTLGVSVAQKSVSCCQWHPLKSPLWLHALVPRPKRPLLAYVSEMTLAPCIRFQSHYKPTFGSQHPNFGFYYRDFTTTIGFHYPTLAFEGVSTGIIPHATRTLTVSAVRARCVRCLLITERPKTPCHYRYQI